MALEVKNPSPNAGDIRDASSTPGSRRSPLEGNGNPLQYSCLENPMDRGARQGYSPWSSEESDTTEHARTTEVFWHLPKTCVDVSAC